MVYTLEYTKVYTKFMAQKFVRKLQRMSNYSYTINLPKGLIDKFGWRERQKLEIIFGGRKHEILIRDWKKKKKIKKGSNHN